MPAMTRALSKFEMDNMELATFIRSTMREELAEGLNLKLKPIKDTLEVVLPMKLNPD